MHSVNEITQEMVNEFNHALQTMHCSFRLQLETGISSSQCNIVIANNLFVNNCVINLTDQFYTTLETFFAKYDIQLHYNNTRSTFWSTGNTNKSSN